MTAIKFSEDGNVLATASTDKNIRIYSFNHQNQYELLHTVRCLSQSPIGYLNFSINA